MEIVDVRVKTDESVYQFIIKGLGPEEVEWSPTGVYDILNSHIEIATIQLINELKRAYTMGFLEISGIKRMVPWHKINSVTYEVREFKKTWITFPYIEPPDSSD